LGYSVALHGLVKISALMLEYHIQYESLIFYNPHYIEWFHVFIRPDEHYIKITDDPDDLDIKMRWALDNPKKGSRNSEKYISTCIKTFTFNRYGMLSVSVTTEI